LLAKSFEDPKSDVDELGWGGGYFEELRDEGCKIVVGSLEGRVCCVGWGCWGVGDVVVVSILLLVPMGGGRCGVDIAVR
jgi:hypothetical protein